MRLNPDVADTIPRPRGRWSARARYARGVVAAAAHADGIAMEWVIWAFVLLYTLLYVRGPQLDPG